MRKYCLLLHIKSQFDQNTVSLTAGQKSDISEGRTIDVAPTSLGILLFMFFANVIQPSAFEAREGYHVVLIQILA
jgi:hypothetical protein